MTSLTRAILVIWVGLALFVVILCVVLRQSVISSALELEAMHVTQDVERARLAIQKMVSRLGRMNADWAQWDDSYAFVVDRNQMFIRRNLVPVSYVTLGIDSIVYLDRAGGEVYAGYCPCRPMGVGPVPDNVMSLLRSVVSAERAAPRGIVVAQGKSPPAMASPILVASHPILTSHAEGPSRGTLIFGLVFDEQEVRDLAALTRLDIDIQRIPGGSLPSSFRRALSRITPDNPVYVRPGGEDRVEGYGVMDDIFGRPAIMIRVTASRGFYSEGRALAGSVLTVLVLAGLVLAAIATAVLWWTSRRQAELEAHKRSFYRSTILAATDGKLVISEPRTIEQIAGPAVASWEIRDPQDIGVIRARIRSFAEESGMDEERIDALLVCAGEAATNAVKHAGGGEASLHRGVEELILVVRDNGPGIEATAIPDVALRRSYTTAVSLGIGYKVMISLADRVYLATSPAGTIVAVQMNLHGPITEPPCFPQLEEFRE